MVTRKVPDPLDPFGNSTIDEPALKNGRIFYKQIEHPFGSVGYDNYFYYRNSGNGIKVKISLKISLKILLKYSFKIALKNKQFH